MSSSFNEGESFTISEDNNITDALQTYFNGKLILCSNINEPEPIAEIHVKTIK